MTENRHKRQTVSLEGVDSGDAPAIVSRDCDYGGHKQVRIRFGHVPIRDLLDIEFRPMLRQNVAIAHVLGACVHEGIRSRRLRPHGSRGRSAPGKTRRCQSRTPYCRIRSSRPAPRSSLRARLALCGFRRTSFHQRRERVGAPPGGGRRRLPCPSPSVMASQARTGGYNASTRDVSWSSTMKEPSFSSLRSSHLARLRYVKCSVRVSLTSGQSTFSTVW